MFISKIGKTIILIMIVCLVGSGYAGYSHIGDIQKEKKGIFLSSAKYDVEIATVTKDEGDYFYINSDKIPKGSGVRTKTGLAGVVVSAGSGAAKVCKVTSQYISVRAVDPACCEKGNVTACTMRNLNKATAVKVGDIIETAEFNGMVAGIPIGTVVSVGVNSTGLLSEAKISPYATIAVGENVYGIVLK